MITVKHDHKLRFPTITMPIYSETDPGVSNLKQSNVDGIMAPLFRINNTTIPFQMVQGMSLSCDTVPSIRIKINDHFDIISTLNSPDHDNMLYVQIIPPFDDAYKKIQLPFHITSSEISHGIVTMAGSYWIPGIESCTMKPYGIISSYELFEQISQEHGLGFCSNVDGSNDARYIYNNNYDIINFLNREILFSGGDGHVYDWWIDFWNNINFVDIMSEYNTIVPDEDMLIWDMPSFGYDADQDFNNTPKQTVALFCNLPNLAASGMHIDSYTPILSSSIVTDTNFEVFKMNDDDRSSTLMQNGDVHKIINASYVYGGEVFGDYDYLTERRIRGVRLNKINSNIIEIVTHIPMLSLMRGGHVNLWWYDIDNEALANIDTSDIPTNIITPDSMRIDDERFNINKTVSGQYYIVNIKYIYDNGRWLVIYRLSRSINEVHRVGETSKETFMQ